MTSSNIGRDKSFVDDLNKERGIVSPRVAFVPRSTEIQPSFCRFVPNHLMLNINREGVCSYGCTNDGCLAKSKMKCEDASSVDPNLYGTSTVLPSQKS